jgi:hypothetical protein
MILHVRLTGTVSEIERGLSLYSTSGVVAGFGAQLPPRPANSAKPRDCSCRPVPSEKLTESFAPTWLLTGLSYWRCIRRRPATESRKEGSHDRRYSHISSGPRTRAISFPLQRRTSCPSASCPGSLCCESRVELHLAGCRGPEPENSNRQPGSSATWPFEVAVARGF